MASRKKASSSSWSKVEAVGAAASRFWGSSGNDVDRLAFAFDVRALELSAAECAEAARSLPPRNGLGDVHQRISWVYDYLMSLRDEVKES